MKNNDISGQIKNPPQIFQQDIMPGAVTQPNLVAGGNSKGDTYFGADGIRFNRLAIGTSYQTLRVVNGIPSWITFPLSGLATNRPTSGRFVGDMYVATDTPALSVWIGASWKSSSLS